MKTLRKLALLLKEVGLPEMTAYAAHQAQLRSGVFTRRSTSSEVALEQVGDVQLFNSNWLHWKTAGCSPRVDLADEVTQGIFHPFGGQPAALDLTPPGPPLEHWTRYGNEIDDQDIKDTWEAARFTWSLDLAGAEPHAPDGPYAECFWRTVETFLVANPVDAGPNWSSAQEIALRAINWIICLGALGNSPASSLARLTRITQAIFQHAQRLPFTLNYARSQNNNHVLSESLGLIFAGEYLAGIAPQSRRWINLGEKEFERALLQQIDDEGNYSQHSAIYHRMMLQLALLYDARNRRVKREMPAPVKRKLELAARWLVAQLDPLSGRLPNLGHNDGTHLLPFGSEEYRDMRPTAQAASLAFCGTPCLPPGKWDDLAAWLGVPTSENREGLQLTSPAVHKVGSGNTWGTLRGVTFYGRPAHCDQLHVDLWWQGINIARDAGTYRYNAPEPWQNSLDRTRIHNTVTIDDLDQMERVSRFLWLDQAQAHWLLDNDKKMVKASQDGYRKLGLLHTRTLQFTQPEGFVVTDEITSLTKEKELASHRAVLHWLLPDWDWHVEGSGITLVHGGLQVKLTVKALDGESQVVAPSDLSIIRGGQTQLGRRADNLLGWESDTYAEKHPALSFSVNYGFTTSLTLLSTWELKND